MELHIETFAVVAGIEEQFNELEDPRIERMKLHKRLDILVIAICVAIYGADTWENVEIFWKAQEKWFRKFLELPDGIPSHDTFNRLDPEQFRK
ncbi:MAG TPA: hypothetical protein DEH25_14555 [Chloroflexi bacterium]|nr:hypothetical protein [Chloroflexota bacterium]